MKSMIIWVHLFAVLISLSAFSKDINLELIPQTVKLYSTGAEISYSKNISLDKGINTVIFEKLPFSIDQENIHVETEAKAMMLSLQVASIPDQVPDNEGYLKSVSEQIEKHQLIISDFRKQISVLEGEKRIILKYDINSTGTNRASVDELKSLTSFYRNRFTVINKEISELNNLIDIENNSIFKSR